MNKRTRAKQKADWQRAYHSQERVEFIQRLPSVVSGKSPCVNAHVRTGGMGRKAGSEWIVPLTGAEHIELHQRGMASFEAKYVVNLRTLATQTEERWRQMQQDANIRRGFCDADLETS